MKKGEQRADKAVVQAIKAIMLGVLLQGYHEQDAAWMAYEGLREAVREIDASHREPPRQRKGRKRRVLGED